MADSSKRDTRMDRNAHTREKATVTVSDLTTTSWEGAVREIIESFPAIATRIANCENVFIKVNAVYFHPHLFTSPALISALVQNIQSIDAKKTIYIMDNCSQGNFTRLCFNATGLDKLARRIGAKCLFLDEKKPVHVRLKRDHEGLYTFPLILQQHLIDEREKNCYINMPVLKTHCQAQMTCGLKNQMGLIYDEDRARRHNHQLHQSIVDIYDYIQPDLTIVDAEKVPASGPMPAGRYVKELLHERNLVFGGTDTVAIDAVAATVLGYHPGEVEHVRLAGEQGYGVADMKNIDIKGFVPRYEERISCQFETHFPQSIRFIKGHGGVCFEGCLGHAEQVLELVVNDGASVEMLEGKPLTIVTGKNFSDDQLENLVPPIVVLGRCACRDALPRINDRYRNVDVLDTCGRCDNILNVAIKRLGVSPAKIAPVGLPKLVGLWLLGKARGLKYNLPL